MKNLPSMTSLGLALGIAGCTALTQMIDLSGSAGRTGSPSPAAFSSAPPSGASASASPSPGASSTASPGQPEPASTAGPGRGFPAAGPWVSFYGDASGMDNLAKVAATFRIINIDADPDRASFTQAQIAQLRAGGRNRVVSYLNLGSIEKGRTYWNSVPAGFLSPSANKKAQIGPYKGYPDEIWMNLADPDWQWLLIAYVAPRLVAQGIDGFYFDNLELVEHGTATDNGPCDAACSQGGLDLVRKLRQKYPNLLFVMQNATGLVTQNGTSGGIDYPTLLDGVAHEDVFTGVKNPTEDASNDTYSLMADADTVAQLDAWKNRGLKPGGRDLWVANEDYVNDCGNSADAEKVVSAAKTHGFSAYISDRSGGQGVVCYWPALTSLQ